jgi:hypothetical protein
LLTLSATWKESLTIRSQNSSRYTNDEQMLTLLVDQKHDLGMELRNPWKYVNDKDLLAVPAETKKGGFDIKSLR